MVPETVFSNLQLCFVQAYGHTMDFTRMVHLLRASWSAPNSAQPNVLTYNAAIAACCRVGHLGRALRLLNEMVRLHLVHAHTCCCLSHNIAHNQATSNMSCSWRSTGSTRHLGKDGNVSEIVALHELLERHV